MSDALTVYSRRTAELDEARRKSIISLCVEAHQEPDFENLFLYLPLDGLHVMADLGDRLISHAVVTTRWIQAEGHPILKTAYVDAVATAPDVQGQGYGSTLLRHLAILIARQLLTD